MSDETQVKITFYADPDLLERLDRAVDASAIHGNRSAWIRSILVPALEPYGRETPPAEAVQPAGAGA